MGVVPEEGKNASNAVDPRSTGTLGINALSSGIVEAQILELTRRSLVGANWFFWIAGLSLLNSVVQLMNGRWGFLAGLGVTQFLDGIAKALVPRMGGAAIAIAFAMDLMAAGVLVLFGLMARQKHTWAFVLGMILYGLDGLLFCLFRTGSAWLSTHTRFTPSGGEWPLIISYYNSLRSVPDNVPVSFASFPADHFNSVVSIQSFSQQHPHSAPPIFVYADSIDRHFAVYRPSKQLCRLVKPKQRRHEIQQWRRIH